MLEKLKREIRALLEATAYFFLWIGCLVLVKKLILAEYQVEFHGLSKSVVGALVLSKVVLILERVPLGSHVRRKPAWVAVALRTLLYSLGVAVVLLAEQGISERHEYGGVGAAIKAGLQGADMHHVYANTICLAGALLGFNVLALLRERLGRGELLRLFTTPVPEGGAEAPRGHGSAGRKD
jgi:hypothetical protein